MIATTLFGLALGLTLPAIIAVICAPPSKPVLNVVFYPESVELTPVPSPTGSSIGRSLFDTESHNMEDPL